MDDIISTTTGQQKARAETEKNTKIKDLQKIEDSKLLLKTEKKKIKELLK